VICGEEFPTRNIDKTCSPECRKELQRVQRRKYYAANSERILAQQRQRQRPIIKPCAVCGKEFDNRKGAKACSPECRKEYRRLKDHGYYLASFAGKILSSQIARIPERMPARRSAGTKGSF
jgi:hypothetical protein